MKNNNKYKATSIVEAMVVMLIIVTWVTGMYKLLNESNKLTVSVKNKIQAVQIARQWIEWFTNIRDTNWLLFSSDYINCWNVLNYESNCVSDNTNTNDIKSSNKYIIYLSSENRWELKTPTPAINTSYEDSTYRNFFKVWLKNWIYSQSWATVDTKPLYTREINVSYLKEDWTTVWDESDQKMKIKSIVQWSDSSSSVAHKIEIEQILSNWKSKK